jgi:hypothetical protein
LTGLFTRRNRAELFSTRTIGQTVTTLVNFMQARGMNERQFISLTEDVGAEHRLPFHTLTLAQSPEDSVGFKEVSNYVIGN